MNLQDRAVLYRKAFPDFQPLNVIGGKRIEALWQIGNSYKGTGYYGSYPGNYLKRIMSMFPDIPGQKILHLFSGSLPPGDYYRIDANPANNPDWVADAHQLSKIKDSMANRFQLIVADPPYSSTHAKKYGFKMINRRAVLEECHKVLSPGGFLVWLDVKAPIYANKKWAFVGLITVYCGTNRDIRAAFMFQKQG